MLADMKPQRRERRIAGFARFLGYFPPFGTTQFFNAIANFAMDLCSV
jgi:hypothetical protein